MSARLTAALLICLTALGCDSAEQSANQPGTRSAAKSLTVAVIPKGNTHEFWLSIKAGAEKAVGELENVEIIWKGPLRENDRVQQIQVVEDFISSGVDGIVLAPLDDQALINPVRLANDAGIPVVIIDSGLQDESAYISFVATDNFNGGLIAGKHLGETLEGKGKVMLVRYQVGSASTTKREEGFLEAIGKFPEVEIVSDNQYAGATIDSAFTVLENLLGKHGKTLDGMFVPCEPVTIAALRALGQAGLTKKIKLVGFDSSVTVVEALEANKLAGVVLQDPVRMGEIGVQTIVKHLRGEAIDKNVSTGETLVTPDNMNEPDHARLLNPLQSKS